MPNAPQVQDTVPIHAAAISQKVAMGALAEGRPWLDAQMAHLRRNRCPPCIISQCAPLVFSTSHHRKLVGISIYRSLRLTQLPLMPQVI